MYKLRCRWQHTFGSNESKDQVVISNGYSPISSGFIDAAFSCNPEGYKEFMKNADNNLNIILENVYPDVLLAISCYLHHFTQKEELEQETNIAYYNTKAVDVEREVINYVHGNHIQLGQLYLFAKKYRFIHLQDAIRDRVFLYADDFAKNFGFSNVDKFVRELLDSDSEDYELIISVNKFMEDEAIEREKALSGITNEDIKAYRVKDKEDMEKKKNDNTAVVALPFRSFLRNLQLNRKYSYVRLIIASRTLEPIVRDGKVESIKGEPVPNPRNIFTQDDRKLLREMFV
jgi:hypothetical protein